MSSITAFGLGKIVGDQRYSPKPGSARFNSALNTLLMAAPQKYRDSITGLSYEVESNNDYIAITYKLTSSSSVWAQAETGRIVWAGRFSYDFDNGLISSASVKTVGRFVTGLKDGDKADAGQIYRPNNGLVANPSDPYSWIPLISDSKSLAFYQGPGGDLNQLSQFRSFGDGKFFYPGWASDPFASNLI